MHVLRRSTEPAVIFGKGRVHGSISVVGPAVGDGPLLGAPSSRRRGQDAGSENPRLLIT